MKKLILMTSALTLVGGTAFAAGHSGGDIDISAEASVTYGDWDARAGGEGFDFSTSLTAALEGTAGGVTYGGEVTVENADSVDLGVIYFSGGFGKFSFAQDEWDVITDEVGDAMYEGTFGDIDVSLVVDADSDEWLATAGYAGNGFNLGLETDSASTTEVSADVTVGNFTVGASADTNDNWDVFASTDFGGINAKLTYDSADVTGIELGGTSGDVTWEVTANTNDETTADITIGFGDASVTIAHDSTNTGGTGDDAVNVLMFEYGMDNLTFHVNLNDADEYEVGATAGFDF